MMSGSLKFVSLNIERSKHLGYIVPLLNKESPDVLCVQELCERDISVFESHIGPCLAFAPISMHPADKPEKGHIVIGSGIFSAQSAKNVRVVYYRGSEEHARLHKVDIMEDINLIMCDIDIAEETFRIATTHFTWTPDGSASNQQRRDMRALLIELEAAGELVLMGDFNAPRGGEIWTMLSSRYRDNIPARYTSSLDPVLHRAAPLEYVVDGLFSTPGYTLSDVRLVSGVSDHMAVVGTIAKS